MASGTRLQFEVDGRPVEVEDDGRSLLEVLHDDLGFRSPKDGCSPQGQCGCCTVLVDGTPRVACVTPARRIAGRQVTTVDGLAPADREGWAGAFVATGGSQCGFCTPGIIVRLAALRAKGAGPQDTAAVERALLAHLCRCTGWRTILEAWEAFGGAHPPRDLDAAGRRATIEGGVPQRVGPDVAVGGGGFADDTAPDRALVAVPDGRGGWAVGETLAEARAAAGKVQGRRSGAAAVPPLDAPPGDWDVILRTSWVEPAYLETDAAWCEPGGEPASPLANGGAFGGKAESPAPAVARRLADEHGRAVRVLLSREDTVRMGAKRPPIAAGATADGRGIVRVVRTRGVADAITAFAPGLVVEEVDVPGPPTSCALRATGWAEVAALLAGARGKAEAVRSPSGAVAEAAVDDAGVRVRIACGDPLDEVVLRSYCVGAAHMALGCVRSEGLAIDGDGMPVDLTIRSFGILRPAEMPPVEVEIEPSDAAPVNGSDAVFAAVAAAAWVAEGCPGLADEEETMSAAKAVGPYTPIVRAGDWLVASGQVGLGENGLVAGGVEAELRQAIANLTGLLEGEGARLDQVVKTTVFLRHMSDYPTMNEVYMDCFGDHRPARSAIGVAEFPIGALVEIEAWAWVGG